MAQRNCRSMYGSSFYDPDGHHWEVLWMDPAAIREPAGSDATAGRGAHVFGKSISDYVRFQQVILVTIAVVGLLRLGLSLAGVPDPAVAWLSMTVLTGAATFYYGVAVHTQGFGGYKQILPLVLFQMVVQQAIAVIGIMTAIAGFPNVYAAPEYTRGTSNQWLHALAHLTVGILAPTLLMWGVGSLVLAVTRRVARRAAVA